MEDRETRGLKLVLTMNQIKKEWRKLKTKSILDKTLVYGKRSAKLKATLSEIKPGQSCRAIDGL
eukprot:12644342-Heterocapsa_arctica.AAC.1